MCYVLLIAWGLWAWPVWSEESFPAGRSGAILLEGNRVVQGRVTPQGDTYAVEQQAGTLIISKQQVRYLGMNLRDVYRYLQDQLPSPAEADDHVDLARWCIGYRMIAEARFQLETALDVDPSREDIRRNLNKLDTLMKRPVQPQPEPVKPQTPAERLAKMMSAQLDDVESLGGLSREAGQEFTRRIQPILMHNCTASACHGPMAKNEFKLSLVVPGSTVIRSASEKNILALLPYIDRENPKSGKLWVLLKTNHGASGRSIFAGAKGKDQLAQFQKWVLSLQTDDDDDAPQVTGRHSTSAIRQTSYIAEQKPRWKKGGNSDDSSAPASTLPARPGPNWPKTSIEMRPRKSSSQTPEKTSAKTVAAPRAIRETQESQAEVEPIVSEERPETPELPPEDPFNPDEFNRKQRVKKY